MTEHEPPARRRQAGLLPLPFPVPEGFLQRLGYRQQRRFVGVYWERAGDEAAFEDGTYSVVGADHYVYWELMGQQPVQDWLLEHEINLGNSDEAATHWLLIDQARNRGYISSAVVARRRVRQQRLEGEGGPQAP